MIPRRLKQLAKKTLHRLGADVVRVRDQPRLTWLGLDNRFDVVIDIGAHDGQFAREAARRFPDARIVCVEPLPDAFAALERWTSQDSSRRRAFNVALSSVSGTGTMNVHDDHPWSSSLLATTETNAALYPQTVRQKETTVQLTTLDDLMSSAAFAGSAYLLKLDVQGHELAVLQGSAVTLQRAAAVLLEVNIQPLYDGQADFAELVALLSAAGLKYAGNLDQTHDQHGRAVFCDALFLRSDAHCA